MAKKRFRRLALFRFVFYDDDEGPENGRGGIVAARCGRRNGGLLAEWHIDTKATSLAEARTDLNRMAEQARCPLCDGEPKADTAMVMVTSWGIELNEFFENVLQTGWQAWCEGSKASS